MPFPYQLTSIARSIDRASFDCGQADLNRWFREMAWQHATKSLSATFVAVAPENPGKALGFYALTVSDLETWVFPTLAKGMPKKVPVFKLGRIAVSLDCQQAGLGASLLLDAYWRCQKVSREVSGIGLIVNAKEEAKGFYLKNAFVQSPTLPDLMFRQFYFK